MGAFSGFVFKIKKPKRKKRGRQETPHFLCELQIGGGKKKGVVAFLSPSLPLSFAQQRA